MQESREEAIKRLTESASSLEARTAQQESADLAAHKVTGEAYKIIADLIGGVLVGLGLGFLADRFLQLAGIAERCGLRFEVVRTVRH